MSSSYRSQKATIAELSVFEKLDSITVLLNIVANAFLALITGVTRAKDRRPESFHRYVLLTAMRAFGSRSSARQQHYMLPTSDDAYAAACKHRSVQPRSVILEDGTKAHWIGSPDPEKIILNFHGGGYVLPCSKEMFEFQFQIIDHLRSKGKTNVSCLMLSYDLAPRAIYPRQLQQAAMLLNHVLHTLKISPANIMLSGDSAGGNLAVALLSHITHPHPSTVVPIPKVDLKGREKLLGAALLSPWLSFDAESKSFEKNAYKDCVSVVGGKKWSSAFLGCPWPHNGALDNYNQAASAPAEWWRGLKINSVLIMAGEEEILFDGIKDFESSFRKAMKKEEVEVDTFFAKGGYHDQPNIDLQMGIKERGEGEMAKRLKNWIASKL